MIRSHHMNGFQKKRNSLYYTFDDLYQKRDRKNLLGVHESNTVRVAIWEVGNVMYPMDLIFTK